MLSSTNGSLGFCSSASVSSASATSNAINRRLSPQRMLRKLQNAHRDWSRLVESLPGDVADIMHRIRRGSFDVHLEHRRLDTNVNRLVLGVLSAALFVGSAFLWGTNVKPLVAGVSLPGAAGCVIAVAGLSVIYLGL